MVVGPPKPDYHTTFTCIWPRALKLRCVTNVDMLFLMNGFICLFYENKFMLISGSHILNRSIDCPLILKTILKINLSAYEIDQCWQFSKLQELRRTKQEVSFTHFNQMRCD